MKSFTSVSISHTIACVLLSLSDLLFIQVLCTVVVIVILCMYTIQSYIVVVTMVIVVAAVCGSNSDH